MKKLSKVLLVPLSVALLSGCAIFDLFEAIDSMVFDNISQYYDKENYSESPNEELFNDAIRANLYTWDKEEKTYVNSGNKSLDYISPQSDVLTYFIGEDQITIYTRYSETIVVFTDGGKGTFLSYKDEEGDEVKLNSSLEMRYLDSESGYLVNMDEEHQGLFRMHQYDDGYLFSTHKNFMFYISNDLENIYVNTENSSTFTFHQASLTLPASSLLNETLERIGEKERFHLPLPNGYSRSVHHKALIDEDTKNVSSFEVHIPCLKATEYVEFLKGQGFEVYRGEEYGLFNLYKEEDGEWIAYDKNHEYKVHIQYTTSYAVLKENSNENWGVELHVMKAGHTFSYFGSSLTTNEDWTDKEKETMENLFGTVLPFIKLGRRYHISSKKVKNGEHAMLSPLSVDVECYQIFDNFYKDVINDSYGDKLIEAGFTYYLCPVDENSPREEIQSWKDSEDIRFYRCYMKEDLDLAVKIYFDDIYGNIMRIFKISELDSWHVED